MNNPTPTTPRLRSRVREHKLHGYLIRETFTLNADEIEVGSTFQAYAHDGTPLGSPGDYAGVAALIEQLIRASEAHLEASSDDDDDEPPARQLPRP